MIASATVEALEMSTTPPSADDWLADAAAVLERVRGGRGVGVATLEETAGMTGLQMMQAMMRGELPRTHIGETMDFMLVEVTHGRAVFQGVPQLKHLNPMGTVHGGWYATLLDSALGCAVHSTMPVGRAYTTAELSVNLVRGAVPGREPLRAIGQVIHVGRQLATADARIVDAAGKLYAHATTTCLVFERPTS
jgi:uncharacterized protein (TIGR00369 family)